MIFTILFWILLVVFLVYAIPIAFTMTWGLLKIVLALILFPFILIGLAVSGLVVLAIPLLAIVGLFTLISV